MLVMPMRWLVCVLLGTLAWGQAPAAPSAAPSGQASEAASPPKSQAPADAAASVPPDAAVITVKGFCSTPKTTAAKTAAGTAKLAGAASKTPPAECKTVVTRAEFEDLVKTLTPPGAPAPQIQQLRQQLAARLPRYIAEENEAKKKGLDKGPRYEELLKFYKMNILSSELERTIREDAAKVPPKDIDDYYKKNPEAYEEFNLDRLFIPRYKQAVAETKEESEKEEKLTEKQRKAKEEQDKAKEAEGEKQMTALADALRARAAAGEDILKLQKEAFDAAGMKIESPSINLPKIRRNGLPAAHAAVFDLKPGEVSQVIADSGGHYVYRLNKKEELPFDQAKDEIEKTLQNQRQKDMMAKFTTSLESELNQAYFGSTAQAGRPGMPPVPRPGVGPGNPRMAPAAPAAGAQAPTQAPAAAPAAPPQPATPAPGPKSN
jgi:parvulin-like peptidyl-prolyl isomerase